MTTHDDVLDRFRSADPVPEAGAITTSQLADVASLVEAGRTGRHEPAAQSGRAAIGANRRQWWTRPVVVFATFAALVLILLGGVAWLARTGGAPVVDEPMPTTTVVAPPAEDGLVIIEVPELRGAVGKELAGVLMGYDPESPEQYKWHALGGFAVTVDSDPFSESIVLGEVAEEWGEDGLWPWASGEAKVPAGTYQLQVWLGTDYCCYSRFVPAGTSGLVGCQTWVTTTGRAEVIEVTDIEDGACDPASPTADAKPIIISIDDWAGVAGYRLLAGVFAEPRGDLVGGAFWTIVDGDPFSITDVVHPPLLPNPRTDAGSWGAEDYAWDETALFEPGRYRIVFWANPGELAPYGSHLPGGPIERTCEVDFDFEADEFGAPMISISDIPVGSGECPPPG